MKQVIFKLFVPLLLGISEASECPEVPSPNPEDEARNNCKAPSMWCEGGINLDGCPVAGNCMYVDPNAKCSARAHCPCKSGQTTCDKGIDADGCPNPPECLDYPSPSCMAYCEGSANCGVGSKECPGKMIGDCQGAPTCIVDDPTRICQDKCPTVCAKGHQTCDAGTDENGCKLEELCAPPEGKCDPPKVMGVSQPAGR